MATRDEIKAAILKVAGDPSTGVIAELADAMADAVAELDLPAKEVRVIKPKETR
jgi:hypothetical protein